VPDDVSPQVVGLYTAVSAGAPMDGHERLQVVEGLGIPGDRYATRRGHWSDPRWKDQQLTLVELEFLERLGLAADALRRNVVTRGVELPDLYGLDFTIGTATLRGMRGCAPCKYIEGLNRPGLFRELEGYGGLRVAVIESGTIAVGDEIQVIGVAAGIEA
jgi:MOSC domain-containing protein YiiM